GEMDTVQAGPRTARAEQTRAFLDDLVKEDPKYDLIFTVDRDGLVMSINGAAASVVGKPYRVILPDVPADWFEEVIQSGSVRGTSWPFGLEVVPEISTGIC